MSTDPVEKSARLTPFQRFLNSRFVLGGAMALSRCVPPSIGRFLAAVSARVIVCIKPPVYWVVRRNQSHVLGVPLDDRSLDPLVRRVFLNLIVNVHELWHLTGSGKPGHQLPVDIPPVVWETIDRLRQQGRGVILAGTHTANFNLSVLALAANRSQIQVLGLAVRQIGGFELMDQLRARAGVHITPLSMRSLREAIARLRKGEIVVTGVDRPIGDTTPTVAFFGQPALLPMGHIKLALKTDAAIIVAHTYRTAEGINRIEISPPLIMKRTGDPETDLQLNLRRVTDWLEAFIRSAPHQWAMFVPVWPE